MKIAVDASVLVGLLNPRDLWHMHALALRDALLDAGSELFYFDCAVAEAISATTRRLAEKKLTAEIPALFDRLGTQFPPESISWIFPEISRLYPAILDLIRSSSGALNFNDALIALACKERGIPAIASFDTDFDQVPWLTRVSRAEDLPSTLSSATPQNQDDTTE